MRFAVVGAGGVGGYFGGRLAKGGAEVAFIARGATLEALRRGGLRVDSFQGDFALDSVVATDDPADVGPVDVVLVAVKAWQIAEVAGRLGPLLGADTAVIPLENGLEASDLLAAAVGRDHVMGGLCGIVSFIESPGHIRHAGIDPFIMFGELDNARSARVDRVAAGMKAAGVDGQIAPDIHRSMWTKFLFIAPMSGVGSVTRVPVGIWRSMPEPRRLALLGLEEIGAIAVARGISLAPDAVERTMERYDGLPPGSTSSLQRDLMAGKPSELEAQIGAVVRLGRDAGVPTPVHDFLYAALLPAERIARGEAPGAQ
jgi:2-dehydropantoate 2-reductase